MCRLLILLLLLLLLPAGWAQMTVQQPFFAAPATAAGGGMTPQSIAGLGYWWVASDAVSSNSSGPILVWPDRIQGAQATNTSTTAHSATNDYVNAPLTTRYLITSPAPLITGTNTSVVIVVKDPALYNGQNWFEATSSTVRWTWQNNNKFYWYSDSLGWGSPLWQGGSFNYWKDFCFVPSNPGWGMYTNNVLTETNASATPTSFSAASFLTSCNGTQVREIMIFTNTVLTDLNRSNIHYYLTNLYGFGP